MSSELLEKREIFCGERIREVRRRFGLKQGEMADATGYSQAQLSTYESGKYSPPIEFLMAIADKYKVNLNWLLSGIGEPYINGEESLPQNLRTKGYTQDIVEGLDNRHKRSDINEGRGGVTDGTERSDSGDNEMQVSYLSLTEWLRDETIQLVHNITKDEKEELSAVRLGPVDPDKAFWSDYLVSLRKLKRRHEHLEN